MAGLRAQGGPLGFDAYMTQDANRRAAHIRVTTGQAAPTISRRRSRAEGRPLRRNAPAAGRPLYGLMAEAHRQGMTAAGATDGRQQKHFATLNGAQQTRLRQAVDTATHSLDVIDTLAEQWKGGSFPALNRANLALAKNGVWPGRRDDRAARCRIATSRPNSRTPTWAATRPPITRWNRREEPLKRLVGKDAEGYDALARTNLKIGRTRSATSASPAPRR